MKVMKTGGNATCNHIQTASEEVQGNTEGCEDCEKIGSTWVHLRLCLECGHVGCCDSSVNKHATKHFKQTVHPVIKSYEPGENWKWCYLDSVFVE
jgi:uncharacterized UBP type Zn finger protein